MQAAHDQRCSSDDVSPLSPNLTENNLQGCRIAGATRPSDKLQPASRPRNPGLAAKFSARGNLLSKIKQRASLVGIVAPCQGKALGEAQLALATGCRGVVAQL